MADSGAQAKVVSEHLSGRVVGHALKHIDRETGDLGPLTVVVKLEDSGGVNECKADFMVPRSFRGRFPIGAYVRLDLSILQVEMEMVAKLELDEATVEMAKRHAAGVE